MVIKRYWAMQRRNLPTVVDELVFLYLYLKNTIFVINFNNFWVQSLLRMNTPKSDNHNGKHWKRAIIIRSVHT